MVLLKRLVIAVFALTLAFGTAACGDDAGEDRIGDGEVNDEGD